MSFTARGSDLGVCVGAEQEWEICHSEDPDPHTPSLNDGHMIIADGDDAGTFDQQQHIRTRNDTELAAKSSSYPTPSNSSAGGCSNPCEHLVGSRGTRSPSPVFFEPNSAPVVAAATGLEWLSTTRIAHKALAEVLPDVPSRTRCEQASWKGCKSAPQSVWTSGQDEQLLHLRDIAQLKWKNIVSYFPEVTLNAVKGRYKHLNGSKMTFEILADETNQRVQMRKRSSYLTSSTPRRAAKKCRASSWTESHKQPISILSEYYATPQRGHEAERAKSTKYVASLAAATYEDTYQRTSRCGRLIRHPFRHRPSEGYV